MARSSRSYQRRADVDLREVDEETFLLDARTGRIYHLNPTAAALWRLLGEPVSLADIVGIFHDAFPDRSERALRKTLRELIADFDDNDLLIEP